MLLREVKEQVFKLPPRDRLALISAIIESLQETVISQPDRSGAFNECEAYSKQINPHRQMKK